MGVVRRAAGPHKVKAVWSCLIDPGIKFIEITGGDQAQYIGQTSGRHSRLGDATVVAPARVAEAAVIMFPPSGIGKFPKLTTVDATPAAASRATTPAIIIRWSVVRSDKTLRRGFMTKLRLQPTDGFSTVIPLKVC